MPAITAAVTRWEPYRIPGAVQAADVARISTPPVSTHLPARSSASAAYRESFTENPNARLRIDRIEEI
ncbi:MAG TPA: hypothetical protein VGM37_16130 [Armatimonadota bacterium]|jgi:hypothetical protein